MAPILPPFTNSQLTASSQPNWDNYRPMVLCQLHVCAVALRLMTRKAQNVFRKKSPTKEYIDYQVVTTDGSKVAVLFREEKTNDITVKLVLFYLKVRAHLHKGLVFFVFSLKLPRPTSWRPNPSEICNLFLMGKCHYDVMTFVTMKFQRQDKQRQETISCRHGQLRSDFSLLQTSHGAIPDVSTLSLNNSFLYLLPLFHYLLCFTLALKRSYTRV